MLGLCGIFTFVSMLFCGDTQDKRGVLIRLACRRGSLLKFRGLLMMRTITAATAFPVPLYGISSLLSAHSASSAVFRDTEKLPCANEVSASKQASKQGSPRLCFVLPWQASSHAVGCRASALSCLHCASFDGQASAKRGLFFHDRNLSGRQYHFFSDFQGMDLLCLENRYQSHFTTAKSSNGSLRLFAFCI